MKRYYNKSSIEKILVRDECPSSLYLWKKELKIFGITIRKEGIYAFYSRGALSWHLFEEPLMDNFTIFVKNRVVYEKPSVTIRFAGGEIQIYRFDSYSEALEFAEKWKNAVDDMIEITDYPSKLEQEQTGRLSDACSKYRESEAENDSLYPNPC